MGRLSWIIWVSQCKHRVLIRGRQECQSQRRGGPRDVITRSPGMLSGQPLEAGKSKEQIVPLESPGGMQHCQHVDF